MRFDKLMYEYYEARLEEMPEIKSFVIPLQLKSDQRKLIFTVRWSDIFGYLLMAGALLHFILGDKLFGLVRLFPGVTFLF